MTYYDYCPSCDYKLEIVYEGKVYTIFDNGHPVNNCPNCLIPLIVIDGELRHDEL